MNSFLNYQYYWVKRRLHNLWFCLISFQKKYQNDPLGSLNYSNEYLRDPNANQALIRQEAVNRV